MPELRIPVTDMRRYLPGDFNRLTIRANSPVQGAGAAILKCALGTLWQHLEGSEEAKICAADELMTEHVEKWTVENRGVKGEMAGRRSCDC